MFDLSSYRYSDISPLDVEKSHSTKPFDLASHDQKNFFDQQLFKSQAQQAAPSEEILGILSHLEQSGIFAHFTPEQSSGLANIIQSGDTLKIAQYIYENTNFADDKTVSRLYSRLVDDSDVSVTDLNRFAQAILKSQSNRLDVLLDLQQSGLLDNLTQPQRQELNQSARHGSMIDFATLLYEASGFAGDPYVNQAMDKLLLDGVAEIREIKRLVTTMERSQESRIKLLSTFEQSNLLDALSIEVQELFSYTILMGQPKDAAVLLSENMGAMDDPKIRQFTDDILSDEVVSLRDLDQLRKTFERARDDRVDLFKDFEKDGILDSLTEDQKNELESLAKNCSLTHMASFLFEHTGYQNNIDVNDVMQDILTDEVVTSREIYELSQSIERAEAQSSADQELKDDISKLLEIFDNKGLLSNLTENQRGELDVLLDNASAKDVARYIFDHAGYHDDQDVLEEISKIESRETVRVNDLERMGYAMERSRDKRMDVYQRAEKSGVLTHLNPNQSIELERIVRLGTHQEFSDYLYQNTGFSSDTDVIQLMNSINEDNVIDLKEIKSLVDVLADAKETRIDLLEDFFKEDLFDNLSEEQSQQLFDSASSGNLNDFVNSLYSLSPFNKDPDVQKLMSGIMSDYQVSIDDIIKLGQAMEEARDNRLDIIKDFKRADILDLLSSSEYRQLDTLAHIGSLKQMAEFIVEKGGFSENPQVRETFQNMLVDDEVSFEELKQLGKTLEMSLN